MGIKNSKGMLHACGTLKLSLLPFAAHTNAQNDLSKYF